MGERQVPPLHLREPLIVDAYRSLGCPGGQRLYELLRQRYYWSGMTRDCIRVCADQVPSQMEAYKFRPPPHFFPTRKCTQPFDTWCIDVVGPFLPVSEEGHNKLVVCVCAFSKWVEAWPVSNLRSETIARLFHLNITARFGICRVVRSDKGREFLGEFS